MLMFENMLKVHSGRAAILVILVCKSAIFTMFTISLTMCIFSFYVSKACGGRSAEAAKDYNYI